VSPAPDDTIAAVATGTGPAGHRRRALSGPAALDVAAASHAPAPPSPRSPATPCAAPRSTIRTPASRSTTALVAVFRAPRSLTGEDVVEIQGHGGR
jgi:tRNA modification GTPase